MSLHILAIDDSTTVRSLISGVLQRAGHKIDLAEDGLQGLERFREAVPDVIITDINMPNLDGIGFIERVRALPRDREIPILVLTTENSTELKQKAKAAGATGWIVKPFDADKLVCAVNEAVEIGARRR